MNQPGVIVLCNNEIAFPALQQLTMARLLKAIVLPEDNAAFAAEVKSGWASSGVEVVTADRRSLHEALKALITRHNPLAVFAMTFPYVLQAETLALLPERFINFHYGLLPRYRGVNPVLSQMLAFETEGGITLHLMTAGIDQGPVVLQQKMPIADTDTFGMQMGRLGMMGAQLCGPVLQMLISGNPLPLQAQDEAMAQYHGRISAANLMINWQTMTGRQVLRMINACNPWNKGAGTRWGQNVLCIPCADLLNEGEPAGTKPGTILTVDEINGLTIACSDNSKIRVWVIYTPQGFLGITQMLQAGIKAGQQLN